MLDILKVRKNTKKDIILSNLYKENEDISDKIFILERIFGLELPKEVDQMVIEEGPIAFVQRETYDEDTVEHIVDFISLFIQNELLEEHKYMNKDPDDHNLEVPPIIIFFDNVYMMDKPSWELLYNLRKNCHRISFVLCIKTDPNNRVIFHPEAVEIATEFYCDENTIDAMIDLPSLEENEIRQMLCDFSQEYTVQMKEEIERMTRIIDPAHSNKTPAESAKLKSEMTKNYNVSDDFNKIQKDVMNTIMSKCEGNPLVSMQFIINLMTSSMVITKEKVLYPNEKKFFD